MISICAVIINILTLVSLFPTEQELDLSGDHLSFLPELLGQNIDVAKGRLSREGYYYQKAVTEDGDTVEWRTERVSKMLGQSLNALFELGISHPSGTIKHLRVNSLRNFSDLLEYVAFQISVEECLCRRFGEPMLDYNDLSEDRDEEIRAIIKNKDNNEVPTWYMIWNTETCTIALRGDARSMYFNIDIIPK